MKSKIVWTILSGVLGGARASRVVVFFDALFHCLEYYDEAMESRAYLFSHACDFCGKSCPADAKFCPQCGRKILSEDEIAAEERAAWEEHYRERQKEDEEQWRTEYCPCGHKRSAHYLEDGHCEATGCGCPQFGEPVENWETCTIVNVGDGPGGFRIVE